MSRDGLSLHAQEDGSKGSCWPVHIALTAWYRGKGCRV